MGRILGIDYGEKRVGLAVTDDLQIIASPLDVYFNDNALLRKLSALCKKYGVEKIILGLPLSESTDTAENKVRGFAKKLQAETGLPVDFIDETASSIHASEIMKMTGYKKKDFKKNINKYAAQKILSDYIETRK
jgi:putative Holliday junction resolvase